MTYAEQIASIATQIASILKPEFDAETYAAGMLEEAEEGQTYFEVRGLHTITGNPHTFSINK